MKLKKYDIFIRSIILVSICYTLIFPHKTSYYCSLSLSMCARTLIPSIFIFLVLSRILSHYALRGLFSGKVTNYIAGLLKLPECLIPVCIMGLFCAAPSGAFAICNIYESGKCTKKQAQHAAALSNNCSAAFILSVAAAMTESVKYAVIILFSNIIATVFIYMIFFREEENEMILYEKPHFEKISFSDVITESICSSSETVVKICGFVLFFSSMGLMLSDTLLSALPNIFDVNTQTILKGTVCSIFEMTSGVISFGAAEGYEKVLLISSAVSFCGLSVIFQVNSILAKSGLDASAFILSRILSAITSPLISLFILFAIPNSISVSTSSVQNTKGLSFGDLICLTVITCLFFIGSSILHHLDKKHKK